MDKVTCKVISARIRFEQHLRTELLMAIPLAVLIGGVFYCVLREYPVTDFQNLRTSIETLTGFRRETDFAYKIPVIISEVWNATRLSFPVVSGEFPLGVTYSSMLLGSLFYHGRGLAVNCTSNTSVVCFDKSTFDGNGSSVMLLDDPKFGMIPVYSLFVNDSSWLVSSSNLAAVLQLYYTPYIDMYTLAYSGYVIEDNMVYRSDYSIESFRQHAPELFALCVFNFSISLLVLLMEFVRCRGWSMTTLFSICVALFGVVLFGLKLGMRVDWPLLAQGSPSALVPVCRNAHAVRVAGNIFLMLLLVRAIVCVSAVHPRLSFLIETLRLVIDDFVHFGFVLISLLLWFAFLGAICFGRHYYYMSTYTRSVFVHFQFLMGAVGISMDQFPLAPVVYTYYIVFGLVMFFTGLFCVLALIVNAYQQYQVKIEQHVARAVLEDVATAVTHTCRKRWRNWPDSCQYSPSPDKRLLNMYSHFEALVKHVRTRRGYGFL